MSDEWGAPEAARSQVTVEFTLCRRDWAVEVTAHRQERALALVTVAGGGWVVGPVVTGPPRLTVCRRAWRFRRSALGAEVIRDDCWPVPGLARRVVRVLRRRGRATTEQLEVWAFVHPNNREPFRAFLAQGWPDVVSCGVNTWTLTPWTRLAVPFEVGSVGYVAEAARFWVGQRRVPSEAQEWSVEVRDWVAFSLSVRPLPPYFREDRYGTFEQMSARGYRRLVLGIEHLPEGVYFTRGQETFSISGRALIRDTADGPVVMTRLLSRIFREALLTPQEWVWHPVGEAFLEACRTSGVRAMPFVLGL